MGHIMAQATRRRKLTVGFPWVYVSANTKIAAKFTSLVSRKWLDTRSVIRLRRIQQALLWILRRRRTPERSA